MIRLSVAISSCFFLLVIRFSSAQNPDFSFPPGGIQSSSLNLSPGASVSSGDLVLDSSASYSEALYKSSFDLPNISFNTYFSISANSSNANGSFAFVIVGDSTFSNSFETQTNALALVFNNTCYAGNFSGNGPYDGYHGWGGGYYRGGGRGHGFGGLSMMTGLVYAGGKTLSASAITSPYPWQNGLPGWNGPNQPPWPSSSCTVPIDPSSYQYEVAIQYNTTSKQITLALGSACFIAGQVVFSQDLSTILSKTSYVGFVASDGAIYTLTQWNFTTNATSSILSSIATSIATSSSSGSPGSPGSPSGSGSKMSKGYVVGFSLLGGGIGVATLVGAFLLYRKRRVMHTSQAYGAEASKFSSTPIKGMMNTKPKTVNEYDTSPLNPIQSRTSSADNASWLKPVAPR